MENMLNPELWAQGLITMLVGMGIVFSFLAILVFAILIMANCVAYINKIWPLPVEEPKAKKAISKSDDSQIALAIAVAMAQKTK